MADIFISYAREDREWVEKLANALTGEGYTVWWDWDLLVGKRYRETIETELQVCKATVVVWSQHSIRSDFVRDEAEEGQQRNILVPLLKENVRPPAGFRQLQTADLTQWTGLPDHVEFRRMMRGLQHVVGGDPAAEKDDEPEAPAPVAAAPVGAAATIAEVVVTPSVLPTPVPAPTPIPTPALAPAPVTPTPQPVVQAKAPSPTPSTGTSPPPPLKPMGTPPGSHAAPLPSPLAGMKIPPSSHPMWRYVAIGGVVFVILIYLVTALWPSPKPTLGPRPIAHTTPPANNGTPSTPPSNGTPPSNNTGDTANEGRHGGSHPANNTAPSTPPANNTPTLGTQPTNMAGVSADIAAVLLKAETADRDARAQATNGLAMQKAALAGTTADSTGMTLGTAALAEGAYGGQLYNGTAQGVGALSYKNGDLYAGQFDEGKVAGRGVVTFANKSNGYGYSGQFADGGYNGFGVYYLSNGWRFEGTFKKNQLDGLGAKIDPTGKVVEQGTYDNGTLK
jgi:hypothetical protein